MKFFFLGGGYHERFDRESARDTHTIKTPGVVPSVSDVLCEDPSLALRMTA